MAIKRKYKDFFTSILNFIIKGNDCQINGNRYLLDIPNKVAVNVHRSYSQSDFLKLKSQWLACANGNLLLISLFAYIPNNKKITRNECLFLNSLIEKIVEEEE